MTGSVSVKAGGGLASEGTAMGGGLRLVAGCSCTARRRPAAPCRLSRRRAGPWPRWGLCRRSRRGRAAWGRPTPRPSCKSAKFAPCERKHNSMLAEMRRFFGSGLPPKMTESGAAGAAGAAAGGAQRRRRRLSRGADLDTSFETALLRLPSKSRFPCPNLTFWAMDLGQEEPKWCDFSVRRGYLWEPRRQTVALFPSPLV